MPPPRRHARRLVLRATTLALTTGIAPLALALPAPPPATVAAPAAAPVVHLLALPAAVREELIPRPAAPLPVPVPTATALATRRPVAAPRPRPRAATRTRQHAPISFAQDLRRQVARLPWYQQGLAQWVVQPGLGNYAVTNRTTGTVYVSPRVPRRRLYSVVAHEWGHVISDHAYDGDLRTGDAAMLRWFGGGSTAVAIERAADCIARILGASWTHYTSCTDGHWRLGARYLAAGWKLPESPSSS